MSLAAAGWCALAASFLLLGAVIVRLSRPSPRVIAPIMAIGSGVLIAAVAYDLVADASDGTPVQLVLVSIVIGATAFTLGTRALSRRQRRRMTATNRANGEGTSSSAGESNSLAIVLASVLDGIPESIVLGLTVLTGGVSPQLMAGIALSNLPEGMASSSGLLTSGWSFRRIVRLWGIVIVASAIAGALGPWLLGTAPPEAAGIVQAFAAGALLAMIVDSMIPEAYEIDRDWTGLLVVIGFVATVGLSVLG